MDDNEEDFIRHWSERAYDQSQLAHIQEIERHLIAYAMEGWRDARKVLPPANRLLICACGAELVLMTQNTFGEWRAGGNPHKSPDYWMPAPNLPKPNGRGH